MPADQAGDPPAAHEIAHAFAQTCASPPAAPSLTPPTLADIEALAEAALATIPPELRRHVKNLVIRVDDFPDEETEEEMGLESPFDLPGLYRGVDMPHQAATTPALPDMVFLFRRPILDYWCETARPLGVSSGTS